MHRHRDRKNIPKICTDIYIYIYAHSYMHMYVHTPAFDNTGFLGHAFSE